MALAQGPDGHIYLTTQRAAELFGVNHSTVSNWRRSGKLTPFCTVAGKPVYRMVDVARAEQAAREAALRTSGTDKRVRRRGLLRQGPTPQQGTP
jgi:Helix-turn-helix domain